MRTLFVILVTATMTLIYGPIVLIARLLRVPPGRNSIYTQALRNWNRAIIWAAGVRVRVHGEEHLQQLNGAVFIANHVSWFDIFALASTVPWTSFVAKSELRRIPLWGMAAEAAGIVFIDRDSRKKAFESYESAAAEVKRGRDIIVCPEGTRGLDYHLRPFKKGPFVLAIAAQAPVVPSVVYGTREIMPKGTFRIRPGVVDLHFLEPVPTVGMEYGDRTQLMRTVWNRMAEAMRMMYGVGTAETPIAAEGTRVE